MALAANKPNPLNYYNLRRVIFPAPHFKYITINKYNPLQFNNLVHWINFNLNNRYYIGRSVDLDDNNSIIYVTKIGFESEKEISLFTISCPYLQE